MSNEHIELLRKIGLGKETVAGTAVAASVWVPKESGAVEPDFDAAVDKSSFGSIFAHSDSYTTKHGSKAKIAGVFRDSFGGHLLMACFGTTYACLKMTMTGGSGTFQVGETVTGGTSAATGVIRRKDSNTLLYVSITSGTFQTGETLTGGTSGATAAGAFDSVLRSHLFSVLNTNAHPSYTIWESNPVAAEKAAYGMMDSFDLELAIDGMLKFDSGWTGMKPAADTCTPAYGTTQNAFVAKHATLKFAADLASLGAATAVSASHFKISIKKNVKAFQEFGSIDIKGQINGAFTVTGELTAVFNATTLRDYVANSSKKAMRLDVANTDVTIGSAGNPTLRLECAKVGFTAWGREGGAEDLVMQKMGFEAQLSLTDAEGLIAILQNTTTAAY